MALDDVKQSVEQNLINAYDKALDKGATEPENKNLENLASTIESIVGEEVIIGYSVKSVINEDGETQTLKITTGGGNQPDPVLQEKSVIPTTSGQIVMADIGYDGLSQVLVGGVQTEQRTFTQNGEYSATSGKFINKVVVNVADIPAVLQEKSVTPTKSLQEVTPDVSYEGLSKVSVNPIPSEYIVPSGTKAITTNGTHAVTEYANVEVNVPSLEGNPIEVSTDADMTNALTEVNVGKVYKFTGTSETYETDTIYIVSEVE